MQSTFFGGGMMVYLVRTTLPELNAQLVRKGYLRKEEKKARSIVIVKRNE